MEHAEQCPHLSDECEFGLERAAMQVKVFFVNIVIVSNNKCVNVIVNIVCGKLPVGC